MAVLSRQVLALALVAACYSPDAPDCTLACTADSDCIAGQACTTDHLCAATGIATCGAHATTDGNAATGSDAGGGSGSATYVMLTLHVDGDGSASTSDGQTCDNFPMPKDCTFEVVQGDPLTVTATPHVAKQFDKWMGGPCDGQPATCQTTPNGAIRIEAKFKM
ncbi:MAG: hypothetical protein ABI467_12070 [Kofleriaceae bacterium]